MTTQYLYGTLRGLLSVALAVLFAVSLQARPSGKLTSASSIHLTTIESAPSGLGSFAGKHKATDKEYSPSPAHGMPAADPMQVVSDTLPAAVSDTLELQEIQVTATRIDQPLSYQPTDVQVVDSARLSMLQDRDLGQLLSSSSTLFIKNNGPGSFSNVSQRGLSSEQIQILWEGIPINNVMLGQKDLALLPSTMFSSVEVSSGTPSTAFGGGSLSGALYLASDWQGSSRLSLQQEVGSYGQLQTRLKGHYQSSNWQLSLRSSLEHAENNFEYFNRAYNRREQRSHNRHRQQNLLATAARSWGQRELETKIWISGSDNQIPGTILATNSRTRQEDRALRWLSSYQTHLGQAEITLSNYLDRVELDYFDPEVNTRSLSSSQSWRMYSDLKLPLTSHLLLKGGLSGVLTGVETNNYEGSPSRRQISALFNPEVSLADYRLRIYPAARLDLYSDFGAVLSPSLGINYALIPERLFLRGQLSRDFNPPTFNALYWGQGGNPDLKPERSNTAEAGITITPAFAGMQSLRITAFHSRVENGIRWYPNDRGVYSPLNVEEVSSNGLEAAIEQHLQLSADLQLTLEQSSSYTRAELSKSRFSGDSAVGHQLRYVPRWKYRAALGLHKGPASGLLQFRYVGRRFITGTENIRNSLDPYRVVDATLNYQKELGRIRLTARAGVQNLLNADYEIVQWYPMPGRNFTFSAGVTYDL